MTRNPVSTVLIVAAAVLALAACDKRETQAAADKVEGAVTVAKQKAESAIAAAGEKIDDAGITASVNAQLAKDPALSVVKIDVDTHDGRVMLSGTAPDNAARDRATQLASAVKGVTSVENRLEVRG